MNVSDLLYSPPANTDPNSKKRPRADTVQGLQWPQGPDISIPTISSLTSQFPERNSLYAYLATLPKPILISMLLDQAKNALPECETQSFGPTNNLAHCVYCHQLFDKDVAKYECQVEHFADLEEKDYGESKEWNCCGLVVDGYADYDENCRASPSEDASPFCYEGTHHDKELQEGDADAVGHWWREWKEGGNTCVKLGCHNKPNGGHLEKRSRG